MRSQSTSHGTATGGGPATCAAVASSSADRRGRTATWSALVTKQWACWDVMRIRARHKFAFWVYHQFVYIRPRCGGERIFLDPYTTGRPDRWREDAFPDRDGFWGGWIYYPVGRHLAGSPAITPQ